jgi:hypothetical protein
MSLKATSEKDEKGDDIFELFINEIGYAGPDMIESSDHGLIETGIPRQRTSVNKN